MVSPTGTPSASTISAVTASSAGAVATPSRSGGISRGVIGPDRAIRPRPPARASPPSTSRLITTSTSDSAHAVGTPVGNPRLLKISVVKVRKPSISNAPYSASRTSATSRQPPRMALRAWPSVIRTNVRTRLTPRLRATSSWPGSALRRLAATGR